MFIKTCMFWIMLIENGLDSPCHFYRTKLYVCTVLPLSIAPCFIASLAYRQNSRLSWSPPLKIPCYTAKLSYCHPPQVFRHKSRKTNLNSPVSNRPQLPFDSCVLIGNYGMSKLVIRHGHWSHSWWSEQVISYFD
jgi:hypothetical protein